MLLKEKLNTIGTPIKNLTAQIRNIFILILSFFDEKDEDTGKITGNDNFGLDASNTLHYYRFDVAEKSLLKEAENKRRTPKCKRINEITEMVQHLKEDQFITMTNMLALDIGMYRIGFK